MKYPELKECSECGSKRITPALTMPKWRCLDCGYVSRYIPLYTKSILCVEDEKK